MGIDVQEIIRQIDEVVAKGERLIPSLSTSESYSNVYQEVMETASLAHYTVHRLTVEGDVWRRQSESAIGKHALSSPDDVLTKHVAILKAMKFAYQNGHLETISVLIHAGVFGDFLEMAGHLLGEGYKDPAAMLTGGVLEEHLRKLCLKNGIHIATVDAKGQLKYKMIQTLNIELYAKQVYQKPQMMQIQSWGAIRNSAAHGKYGDYVEGQVVEMHREVLAFINRHPA